MLSNGTNLQGLRLNISTVKVCAKMEFGRGRYVLEVSSRMYDLECPSEVGEIPMRRDWHV